MNVKLTILLLLYCILVVNLNLGDNNIGNLNYTNINSQY